MSKKSDTLPLVVNNYERLQIYPLCNLVPILIEGSHPAFLSMIPGKAHHLLSKLTYAEYLPLSHSTIGKTERLFKAESHVSQKAYFCGEVITPTVHLHLVVNSFSSERIFHLHRVKDSHSPQLENYMYFEKHPKKRTLKLTYNLFALEVWKTVIETTPSTKAVRFGTAGQESEEIFRHTLLSEIFWNDQHTLPPLLKYYLEISKQHPDSQQEINSEYREHISSASPEEKNTLLALALLENITHLALYLINDPDIDVNQKNALWKATFVHMCGSI